QVAARGRLVRICSQTRGARGACPDRPWGLANRPGSEAVGESAHDALDQPLAAQIFRSERGLCPPNRILGGGSEGELTRSSSRVGRGPPLNSSCGPLRVS